MNSGLIEYVDKLSDVSSSSEDEDSSKVSITMKQEPATINVIEEQIGTLSDDIVGEEGVEPNIWVAQYIGNSDKTIQVQNKL